MIKCPECGEKAVAFCRDEIVVYKTFLSSKGVIKVSKKVIHSNQLDECWLECNKCCATSENSNKLDEMLESIEYI